jgi:hypothetical protein
MSRICLQNSFFQKLKNLHLTLALVTLFGASSSAQCPTGNVTFATQSEINQFAVNYPNCTEIAGLLTIEGDDITDLTPLSNLTTTAGGIQIYDCPQLTSCNGLHNVTQTSILWLQSIPQLQSLTDFSGITALSGTLVIRDLSSLVNLNGLHNITTVGGFLRIRDNAALLNIDALNNLTSIGEYLNVRDNPLITNLNGLASLTSISQEIDIIGNTALSNISALQNTSFAPNGSFGLTITDNPALSICDLPNFCTYLSNPSETHPRVISGNAGDCATEDAVVEACASPQCPPGDVSFNTQEQVNQFILDYPNCTELPGNLFIGANSGTTNVVNLQPFQNIQAVIGNVTIMNNGPLSSLNGLNNLTTIGGLLHLNGNTSLLNLNALSNLTDVTLNIGIHNHVLLTDISGLQNATINNDGPHGLNITDNTVLSICNLPNICAYLANPADTHPRYISNNTGDCATIDAVVEACSAPNEDGCTTITSQYIQWPPATYTPTCTGQAVSIHAECETGEFSKVQLTAQGNYYFSSSVATHFVTVTNEDASVIYAFGTESVSLTPTVDMVVRFYTHLDSDCNGNSTYHSRMVRCNGVVGVDEVTATNIAYFPNPVNDILNLSSKEKMNSVEVISMLGHTVFTQSVNATAAQLQLNNLAAGNYLVKIKTDNGVEVLRIAKH